MRSARLLYKREDAEKNRVLIDKYSEALKARGFRTGLVLIDRLSREDVLAACCGAELVINRARDSQLVKFLENEGLFVTNPSVVTETANDKFTTYERLRDSVPKIGRAHV